MSARELPDLPLTPEDVGEIVAILKDGAHDRLEITTARFRLRLERDAAGAWTQEWQPLDAAVPAGATAAAPAASMPASSLPEEAGLVAIRPPLPGTFYRAPKPGAPPFVEVGSRVAPDTVVCILETMKLMNTVHAGVAGEIVAIHAENGVLVDREAVLMHVRPGG